MILLQIILGIGNIQSHKIALPGAFSKCVYESLKGDKIIFLHTKQSAPGNHTI